MQFLHRRLGGLKRLVGLKWLGGLKRVLFLDFYGHLNPQQMNSTLWGHTFTTGCVTLHPSWLQTKSISQS